MLPSVSQFGFTVSQEDSLPDPFRTGKVTIAYAHCCDSACNPTPWCSDRATGAWPPDVEREERVCSRWQCGGAVCAATQLGR